LPNEASSTAAAWASSGLRSRTIAWLHGFRRLRIRWERRDDVHEAFLGLVTCLITHRHVQRPALCDVFVRTS
jgi:hypothetical protein